MRTMRSTANVYAAANDGEYPSSLKELVDEEYLEGPISAYDCPSGGTIDWNFNPCPDGGPPDPVCSLHGSPD